jgi:hypothetical protein
MTANCRREIVVEGSVAYIPLTRGYVAIIDASEVDKVSGHVWHAYVRSHTIYAVRSDYSDGKMQKIGLHRVLAKAEASDIVDHCNGNGLDNRRSNLRLASAAQNCANRRRARNNTSGAKGVVFVAKEGKFWARIMANGRRVSLGYYGTAEQASAAYQEASKRLHGEFGRAA